MCPFPTHPMPTMKHIAFGPGPGAESMRLTEGLQPEAGPGELLIEVDHAGVNRPDVQQRAGKYPPPPGASPILGLEVSGKVAAVGEGVSGWNVGDAVCALTPGGGYAQYCVAPAGQVLPVPKGWTLEQAAGLCETWFTVWANLVGIARVVAGETVLVHGGSSGIGLAAIELLKLRGAHCIVTVGDEEKARFCREFGAQAAINYKSEDFVARVRELTNGDGVDVVLDMVAGDYVPRNLSLLRRNGRLVLIALAARFERRSGSERGDAQSPGDHRFNDAAAHDRRKNRHPRRVAARGVARVRGRQRARARARHVPAGAGRRGAPPHGKRPPHRQDPAARAGLKSRSGMR